MSAILPGIVAVVAVVAAVIVAMVQGRRAVRVAGDRLQNVTVERDQLAARVAELEDRVTSIDSLYRMEAQADRTRREIFNEELLAGLIARVAELEEQVSSLTAKLDERQAALVAIADGVNEPIYEAEEIDDTLEDCGLSGFESAEYGWNFCQESYRSWIEGLTAALLPSGDDGVSE